MSLTEMILSPVAIGGVVIVGALLAVAVLARFQDRPVSDLERKKL